MLKKLSFIPMWIIFLLNIGVTLFSFLMAFVIKQNLELTGMNWRQVFDTFVLLFITNVSVFASVKTYSGIVRYTGLQDAVRIAISIALSAALLFLVSKASAKYNNVSILDNVIIILYGSFSFLSLISYRIFVKFLFSYAKNYKMKKKTVVIFGAGEAGVATKRVLEHDTNNNIDLLAFIDDDRKKNNKALDGVPIVSFAGFTKMLQVSEVDELIIASFTIPTARKMKW